MFKTTEQKLPIGRSAKFAASSLALLMCTACGGGSSSSSSPTAAINQAPVVTVSKLSIVSEGQPFELDASGSTDRNGDSLTYSWRQLTGPTVEIASPTSSKLSLVAPVLDGDEGLSFEVSVSDGALTSVSTVSLDIEDIKANVALSESTEFGTGGPANPAETVPDPSVFEGRKPLDRIIGLTSAADGGYTVHWTASGGGHDMPVSSQAFSADGEKVGAQVDGVFLGGDQETFELDGRTLNRFIFGLTFATVQSGDTLYNLNVQLEIGDGFTIGYGSHRGLVEGEIDGFGDTFIEQTDFNQRTMGGAFTPIGQDNILLTLSERTTDDPDDEDARVIMTSYVIDTFGQTVTHELGEYVSNGTTFPENGMTATSYAGDSYLAAWAQNTEETGYDIRMQRANEDGILLGTQSTVNDVTDGNQFEPRAATLTDGNIFVTWLNETEEDGFEIRASIVRQDGTFATDEVTLGLNVSGDFEGDFIDRPLYALTALNTNEVVLTWEEGASGEETVQALVFDAELNVVSNMFQIASGVSAENISALQTVTLPDNRVILGWFNDYNFRDERVDTSHTVGFYPVGKE